jgi:hypothetical protein
VEHYVTAFEFVGGGARFGSIVPLPGVPTRVIKAGDWTLQRLLLEVRPPAVEDLALPAASARAAAPVEVILKTRIDSLDVTVLKGGARAVGLWARRQGFLLPPDAPEVLDFYARRSPVFMAVKFNPRRAAKLGQRIGDSIPVHAVIPIDRPWVPLRILGLGARPSAPVEADVFLLTPEEPALLPGPREAPASGPGEPGLVLARSEEASEALLGDLRSDRGMKWLPAKGMWLTYLQLQTPAGRLTYDLAIDPTGQGRPSAVDAGLVPPRPLAPASSWSWVLWMALGLAAVAAVGVAEGWRGTRAA